MIVTKKKYKIVNNAHQYGGIQIPDDLKVIFDTFKEHIKKILEIIFFKNDLFNLVKKILLKYIENKPLYNYISKNITYEKTKKNLKTVKELDDKIDKVLKSLFNLYISYKNKEKIDSSYVKRIIDTKLHSL